MWLVFQTMMMVVESRFERLVEHNLDLIYTSA